MPLALLPSSNLLLEVAPEVLQKQLELIPGQLGTPMAANDTRCPHNVLSSIKVIAAAGSPLAQHPTNMHLTLQYIKVTNRTFEIDWIAADIKASLS